MELNFDKILLKVKIVGLAEMCQSVDVTQGKPLSFLEISEKLEIPLVDVFKIYK